MKTEFDDALKGIYHEYDEVSHDERTVDYRQIGTLGVCSLAAALVSILGFFWLPFILVSILGVVCGALAFRKILGAPDEVGGWSLTLIGLTLSVVIGVSATIFQIWYMRHNAPPGYTVIDFADLSFDASGKIKKEVLALDGKKIFVKGYMYPTNRQSGIEDFTMVRTLAHCKFCSPGTNPADMIAVSLENGMSVSFRATKTVSVGGLFSVDPDFVSGEIPYSIDANVFR